MNNWDVLPKEYRELLDDLGVDQKDYNVGFL